MLSGYGGGVGGGFFFFNDTATTEIYTLSLHDALPILTVGTSHPGTVMFLCCALGKIFVIMCENLQNQLQMTNYQTLLHVLLLCRHRKLLLNNHR